MKANTWTWAALLLLSAGSFALSESARSASPVAFILGAAGLKSAMLGWQFMELRRAHLVWRMAMLALLVAILGLVYALSRTG